MPGIKAECPCKECIALAICRNKRDIKCDLLADAVWRFEIDLSKTLPNIRYVNDNYGNCFLVAKL